MSRENHVTRRTALKIVAGTAVATVAIPPVIVAANALPGAEADAALIDAIERFHAAEDAYGAATDAADFAEFAARDHYPPKGLLNLAGRMRAFVAKGGDPLAHSNIDSLEDWNDLLAEAEAADREKQAVDRRYRVAELRAREDELEQAKHEALEAFFAVPATTLAGFSAKFHFFLNWGDGVADLKRVVDDPDNNYVEPRILLSLEEDFRRAVGSAS